MNSKVNKNKLIVVYKSKYGSTKQYAEWIAEELGCDISEASLIKKDSLDSYDTVIYGGGLYAGSISGVSLVLKNWEGLKKKNIIIFTVSITNPDVKEYFRTVNDRTFTTEQKENIKVFHLHGGIDYTKLRTVHRLIMKMINKSILNKKSGEELNADEKIMIEAYGKKVDFSDRKTITPLVECALK